MPLRLLIGLGNPGPEYENTRHNAGFMIIDRIAARLGATWAKERKFDGWFARADGLYLLKPKTFMNLSGKSVAAVSGFFKIPPADMLAIYDDVALPEGRLRIKPSGSAGGHNGIKSMIASLGSDQFPRLRFGVGAAEEKSLVGHVLGRFDPSTEAELHKSLEKAADAAIFATLRGLESAMNQFNTAEPPRPKPARPLPTAGQGTAALPAPTHPPEST
ncbi:MAG: pth [Verrucomicrobiales bacterium]|nr:pth [Verrucomicrobiales bacterium]